MPAAKRETKETLLARMLESALTKAREMQHCPAAPVKFHPDDPIQVVCLCGMAMAVCEHMACGKLLSQVCPMGGGK